jgi:hypothetical protein
MANRVNIGQTYGGLVVLNEVFTDKQNRRHYECQCNSCSKILIMKATLISANPDGCRYCWSARVGLARRTGYEEISGDYWFNVKNNAKNRNLPFTITIKYAWTLFINQGRRCALSGRYLILDLYGKDKTRKTASIDRINSKRGYVPGNIQWIHKDFQPMKSNKSQSKFLNMCAEVANYQVSKKGFELES